MISDIIQALCVGALAFGLVLLAWDFFQNREDE